MHLPFIFERFLKRSETGKRRKVNWQAIFTVIGATSLAVLVIGVIVFSIRDGFQNDDRKCVAAWGVDFDHQTVDEGGENYVERCVNSKDTNDKRPIENVNRQAAENEYAEKQKALEAEKAKAEAEKARLEAEAKAAQPQQ